MPLDADHKRMIGKLDAFGQAVRRDSADPQAFSGIPDPLVVAAVDLQAPRARDGGKQGARPHVHRVRRLRRDFIAGVADRRSELLRQVLVQRPAQDAGQDLYAAADGQERHPARQRFPAQGEFHGVPAGGNFSAAGLPVLPV